MKLMLKYMSPYKGKVTCTVILKFIAVIMELLIPYILEYMIDEVAPAKKLGLVLVWGVVMIIFAVMVRYLNIVGNRIATGTARNAIYELRKDLFKKTMYLSGTEFDAVSLPSLISRMTSDSYNVQTFLGMIQRIGVRAPIMLIGGIIVAASMDTLLTMVLLAMIPVLAFVVLYVSRKGIPMFMRVQSHVDVIVRIMRENISGIRVIRALSRNDYEKERFNKANEELTSSDIKAGMTMALPDPIMHLFLNIGLTIIVIIGAYRVNEGLMKTGVILAFLTYFNMIMMAVMGINRLFIRYSKAGASADRIESVLNADDTLLNVMDNVNGEKLQDTEYENAPVIEFEDVRFIYNDRTDEESGESDFAGESREAVLKNISFEIKAGESLGIIGSTGCGKTTIINLLMRFYDVTDGAIKLNGRDIRTMELKDIRKKIGVVFQNDTIFNDTLAENIRFGRDISEEEIVKAAKTADIANYIESLDNGYNYMAAIKGMNLSGGQRQRLLIARALAGNPEILIFDDSSSALDYKTDAVIRNNIQDNYDECIRIVVAQRASSVKNMSHILVMEDGEINGYGTHEDLLENCKVYRDIYESQMGEMA